MRTNNGKVKNVIISLYFILIVLVIVLTTLLGEFKDIVESQAITYLIILVVFGILIIITHRICKYFEYDSDGMKVVILNKGMLLSDYFNYREYKLEFDKKDLKKYKIRNFIFIKVLVLYVKGRNDELRKETFNVTLVSRKKRKYIRQSLSKIIRHNKKLDQEASK